MALVEIGSFLLGLALLVLGAEWLVRAASRLAGAAGISPLVIGLTVVAFGTSAPELAISVGSTLGGNPDIAIGNVVGSNIANILLILGLAAVVAPLVVRSRLVRLDVPVMIGLSVLVLLLGLDGAVGRADGLVLIGLLAVYLVFQVRRGRQEGAGTGEEAAPSVRVRRPAVWNVTVGVAGLGMLVVGANLLVDAAVTVATRMGLGELVVGLTLVAVGTSLPEIATSLVAVARGERDIAVGNAVGSNVFNLLAVLGISGLVAGEGVPVAMGALDFDLPVMVAVAIAALPIFFTGHRIARWEGVLFLGYYAAYTAYLVLDATGHDALEPFSAIMLWFVGPLTLVTVAVSLAHSRRREASSPG